MLSSISRFLFAMAAISPVALVWAIVDWERNGLGLAQLVVLLFGVTIGVICWLLLLLSHKHLTKVSFTAIEIKAVDNEVVAYVVTYLFPLVAPESSRGIIGQIAVILVLAIVLATSNAFTFNPLLTIMGYRFYEVKSSSGVTYLLVSKSDITDVKRIRNIGRLSRHLLLQLD